MKRIGIILVLITIMRMVCYADTGIDWTQYPDEDLLHTINELSVMLQEAQNEYNTRNAKNPNLTTITDYSEVYSNESLRGRGYSDIGRNEPNYLNVIGYVAVSSSQEVIIKKTDDFQNESLWSVPVYEKDKQFWNPVGTMPHKTEVVVRKQYLKHEGYGAYSGYLLVEQTESGEQNYIDVSNFITKPYWTYQNDLKTAAVTGIFVAEYKQMSDYYPVDSGGKKLLIPDGSIVLVTGITGSTRRANSSETDITAIVWKEWLYGYGGVTCYFNHEDLKIVY